MNIVRKINLIFEFETISQKDKWLYVMKNDSVLSCLLFVLFSRQIVIIHQVEIIIQLVRFDHNTRYIPKL